MKLSGHRIRHLALQAARRGVQVFVLLLMLGLIYLSLYSHYRAAHALEDETQTPGARAAILKSIDAHVSTMADPQKFLDDNKGTVWSMRLRLFDPAPDGRLGRLCASVANFTGGLDLARPDLTDPLAAAEAVAAGKRVYGPLLWSIFFPVLVTLILGKVFCSWICPANLLFEITGKLRKLLRFAELPPAEVKFSRKNKYVLLAVGLLTAGIVGLPIFALIYPPAAVSRLLHAWVFGTSLWGVLALLGAIAVFELVVSPRWWCRTMCPGGALYGLLGWPRLLRIKLDADRCTRCRKCEPVCEPGLNPVVQSAGIECDNCSECVGACPEQALYYSIGLPRRDRKSKSNVQSDARQGVKIGAALVLGTTLLGMPSTARAHHILGLPHYSYKENYPQAPVLEYPATTGPYSVLLQCYPGTPIPAEQANLVFDIKNTETGKRYDRPITVRVVQTFTFGANEEVLAATEVPAYDVLYKLSATFPDDGEYVVEMTMDVEGRPETIGFLMIAGDPGAGTSVVILTTCVAGLALFLITVRAVKKKRDRRRQLAVA